ncbi:ACT domain-containing protein [Tateyamaria pelophila]|uniref:ACT domain-containing protein n=1 Tax=Tateyamaria pelophila TaxID=328415 RepID=UPI001CBFB52A|nr:ACT domain-containing protein [Tateyamaria pelophila]
MTTKDTSAMIAGMTPELQPGIWVFCSTQDPSTVSATTPDALAIIRESEGITLILRENIAKKYGFDTSLGLRQITLSVFSDLEGVGLTAAVARTLTDANIPCNVIAAFHHDHILVPAKQADQAMAALLALQHSERGQ